MRTTTTQKVEGPDYVLLEVPLQCQEQLQSAKRHESGEQRKSFQVQQCLLGFKT